MTMSTTADSYVSLAPRSLLATLASTGVGALRWLVEKVLLEIEVRRALHEIRRFDDQMLRDIGLDRGGLEHPLRHGVIEREECSLRQ
jgi:hypothetical protein